jgi:DUF971 family protein
MPLATDNRRKPADVRVYVSTGAGVDIAWADGHRSHYEFDFLRDACPCATCNDERRKKAEAAERMGAGMAAGGSAVLPMFKPKLKARGANPVGHYALQIDFSDGHSTGIYSFDYLREICPCDACKAERAAAQPPES